MQLDAAHGLAPPGTPASSVHLGTLGEHVPEPFRSGSTDLGAGRFTVDVVLGAPCGATAGGTLFTLDLAAVGPWLGLDHGAVRHRPRLRETPRSP